MKPITVCVIILTALHLSILPTVSAQGLREGSLINPENVRTLMQEQIDLGPRVPGSQSSLDFSVWVKDKVAATDKWTITSQNFSYMDTDLRNFVIKSNASSEPEYLVAAHYDSRAIANSDPNPSKRDDPVPGANDGASGVAAILEMIKRIPDNLTRHFGFLLFDAEDQGSGGITGWDWIVGAEHYARGMTEEEVEQTKAFILLDMIGDDELSLPYEGYSDAQLVDEIWTVGDNLGYGDIFLDKQGPYLIDDHRPFINRGIPSIDIIDFDYPEWHTTKDDMKAVSEISVAIVADVVLTYLLAKVTNSSISEITSNYSTSYPTNRTAFSPTTMMMLVLITGATSRKFRRI